MMAFDPFFFSDGRHRIYGCFHQADPFVERDHCAILIPPLGQEYVRAHRTVRLVAEELARLGISCLRFDPLGLGHSDGDHADANIAVWLGNIGAAIAALRERSPARRVGAVGIRFGATLAMLYGSTPRCRLQAVAAWDPIIRGREYIKALRDEHRAQTMHLDQSSESHEFSGFNFSQRLISEIEELTSEELLRVRGQQTFVLCSGACALPCDPPSSTGHQHVDGLPVWSKSGDAPLVCRRSITAIVSWFDRISSES